MPDDFFFALAIFGVVWPNQNGNSYGVLSIWTKIPVRIFEISSRQMEQKIPGDSDISEKIANFERLPKFFEMNEPKITVLFDSEPKIPKNFFLNGSRPRKFPEFPIFRKNGKPREVDQNFRN